MLRAVAADVQKHYYDAKLRGVNWNATVHQAGENIAHADSLNGAISEIAAALDSLHDSHTYFVPPPRPYVHDYGFKMQMIGDHCYVVRVRPGSDAEKKGLKPGDEILAVNELRVSRETLWRLHYIYSILRPQPGLRVTVKNRREPEKQLDLQARFQASSDVLYPLGQGINQWVRDTEKEEGLVRPRYFERGDKLLVVRIPGFAFPPSEVDGILNKMRQHRGVILDLRGNPGGFEDTLDRLLGGLFENDQKIYDRVARGSTRPVIATGRHRDAFTGRLIVLIDSKSASASELLARVVQLERRGFILGDHSAGSVMEGKLYPHQLSLDAGVLYAASVTEANLVMADGKSLEHVGVEPDIEILPSASDLANRLDPVMAKAAALLDAQLSPQEAGTMFPDEDPAGR